MSNRLWLVIPFILLMAGCATCDKKLKTIDTRVTALENRSSETTRTETPAVTETQVTPAPAAPEIAIPETPSKKDIQTALKNAGFYTGEIDGKLGHKTKKAIEQFQKTNDLKVDGKVGPNTWNKLKTYYTAATETK